MEISKQIKLLIKKYAIYPSKQLGQNFLVSSDALRFIQDTVNPAINKTYIEIGAGFLFCTMLIAEKAKEVIAIEKDRRFVPYYNEIIHPGIKIIIGDALKMDFSKYGKAEVFGNIPYNISSPLILKLADTNTVKRIVLLLQKEFARRILAGPNNKDYGAITAFTDFFFEKKFLKTLPPHFFYPMPSVSSTVIELKRKEVLPDVSQSVLFHIIRDAFLQRRKTLLNALKKDFNTVQLEKAFANAGLPLNIRGESLSLDDFICIAKYLEKHFQ